MITAAAISAASIKAATVPQQQGESLQNLSAQIINKEKRQGEQGGEASLTSEYVFYVGCCLYHFGCDELLFSNAERLKISSSLSDWDPTTIRGK